jgi:hypothetical protein
VRETETSAKFEKLSELDDLTIQNWSVADMRDKKDYKTVGEENEGGLANA